MYTDSAPERRKELYCNNRTAHQSAPFCLHLRQHRTKPAWRLGGTSACIFSVILHRNSLLGASPAASFLYNL
ncbi:MAG: hypothetical protein IKN55_02675, partial [Oscillospiraceae bacterium]|nr:hypothetical protein [Oscillospiraceae bacterium]